MTLRAVVVVITLVPCIVTQRMKMNRHWWVALLVCQKAFADECTSIFCTAKLWDKNTFAHSYEPAQPANLRLSFSDQKQDVLVEYDETRDGTLFRHRAYYADRNVRRVNNHRKPRFTSVHDWQNLHPIPVTNALTRLE